MFDLLAIVVIIFKEKPKFHEQGLIRSMSDPKSGAKDFGIKLPLSLRKQLNAKFLWMTTVRKYQFIIFELILNIVSTYARFMFIF